MCSGEGPIGAAKGKQTNTMASCQPPTPPHQDQRVVCAGGGGGAMV